MGEREKAQNLVFFASFLGKNATFYQYFMIFFIDISTKSGI
jgi:hypothetical protein